MAHAPPRRLVVYSRDGCQLCEEMIGELSSRLADRALRFEVRDVDGDAQARRRYGLKVPVLTVDGEPVCSGRLDPDVLAELLGE